jgi:dolichol-phosphate mannosyltransferase
MELSVIIPTQNDEASLDDCLSALHAEMLHSGISLEVLIVDDASTDRTVERAVELSTAYPDLHLHVLQRSEVHPGFGAMVRYAAAHASGRYCVLVAADGSDPVELIPKMVVQLREGKQLVICSRYGDPGDEIQVGVRYRLYQRVYRAAIKIGLGQEITDSTNGFRAFNRRFYQAIGLTSNRFSVCPEMTFKALLAGGQIGYLPGQPNPRAAGDDKFKLPHEIFGYGIVLTRAALHRLGLRWF